MHDQPESMYVYTKAVPVGGEASPEDPELEILEPVNGSVVIMRWAPVAWLVCVNLCHACVNLCHACVDLCHTQVRLHEGDNAMMRFGTYISRCVCV